MKAAGAEKSSNAYEKSGMENAKAKGKKIGRPHTTKEAIPAVFCRHDPAFLAGRISLTELARLCRLTHPTVYKYLKLLLAL